jgi:glucan phosphoethanolaminetransferase (alkaline phosphatase superfamily)
VITPQNYLDLGHLFFFEIVGDFTLAFILGLVFIAYAGVRWRIPLEVSILGVLLWTGAVVSYAYNAFWWMLILLLFGLIIYAFLPRIIKRG